MTFNYSGFRNFITKSMIKMRGGIREKISSDYVDAADDILDTMIYKIGLCIANRALKKSKGKKVTVSDVSEAVQDIVMERAGSIIDSLYRKNVVVSDRIIYNGNWFSSIGYDSDSAYSTPREILAKMGISNPMKMINDKYLRGNSTKDSAMFLAGVLLKITGMYLTEIDKVRFTKYESYVDEQHVWKAHDRLKRFFGVCFGKVSYHELGELPKSKSSKGKSKNLGELPKSKSSKGKSKNLDNFTVVELKALAKKRGETGHSKMRKAELIKLLKKEQMKAPAKKVSTKKEMTVVELRALCKKKGVRGYSKMRKDQLIKVCK